MSGVIQEIDLVIAQQAVAKATADAEKAGAKIADATARGRQAAFERTSKAELDAAEKLYDASIVQPAGKAGTKAAINLTAALQRQFRLTQADTAEALARGLITPQVAQQRGADAARAFNVGVLSQIQRLGTTGGLSGPGGQTAFIGLAGSLKSVTEEGTKATHGLATMRSGLLQTAMQAANLQGSMGTVVNGLLAFAGGGAVTIAVVAGLALIAKAWELITSSARKAKEESVAFFKQLDSDIKARTKREQPEVGFGPDFEKIRKEVEDTERKIAELQGRRNATPIEQEFITAQIDKLQKKLQELGARALEVGKQVREAVIAKPTTEDEAALERQVQRLGTLLTLGKATTADRQQALQLERQFRTELAATTGTDEKSQERRLVLGERIAALTKQQTKDLSAAAREAKRLADEEARNQEQLAEKRTALTAQLQDQLATFTKTGVDDLENELHQLQVKIIETFGAVGPEAQKVLDGLRERLRNLKFIEGFAPQLEAFKKKAQEAVAAFDLGLSSTTIALKPEAEALLATLTAQLDTLDKQSPEYQKILDLIKEIHDAQNTTLVNMGNANVTLDSSAAKTKDWADAVRQVAQAALDLANGLGIVDQQTSKVLQGFISLGTNLGKAMTGDPTAIIGAVGGLTSILGGAFGGEDPATKAMNDNIRKNVEALRDNTAALEGATASQTQSAISALNKLLLSQPHGGQEMGAQDTPSVFGWGNLGRGSRLEVDAALRKFGITLKDLEEIAKDAGIDISDLSRTEFVQLQEAISDTDIAALEAAEAQAKLAEETQKAADAATAAADALRKAETQRSQLADINDATDPLARARLRADVDRSIPGLQGILGQNLGHEEGRAAAEALIRQQFDQAANLTTFQRGGLSVEDFRALLVEWETAIDDIAAASKQEAENREQAAKDAKQALLDQRRLNEEKQVADRQALEDQQAFQELQRRGGVVGGAAEQAVERAARLIAQAVALASGPLGTDSPLFQDAQRRADQARAEAERLVGEAEQQKAGDVSAGFTLQHSITQSSAGQVLGELTTSNVWLEKIWQEIRAARGMPTGAGAVSGAGPGLQITVPVMLDGREIARVVSQHQAGALQQRASLNGNSALPS